MRAFCFWAGIVFCLSVGSLQAGTNLLRNASFEIQGSYSETAYSWEEGYPDYAGGMWYRASRRDWRSMSGSWCGAICGTWSGWENYGGFWQKTTAIPGRRYRFAAWFWADGEGNKWTASDIKIRLIFSDNSQAILGSADLSFNDIGPNWVRKVVEGVAPPNTAHVEANISATGVGYYGALQFDDLELVEVEAQPAAIHPGPSSRRTGLVISEVMYHPAARPDGKNLEYVELYNTTPFTNQLEGVRLSGDVDYEFSDTDVLPPFSYLVVAKEPASLEAVYGISNVRGPFEGALPNSGGTVRLRNAQDAVLWEVEYSDEFSWPLAADGAGHSLVLRHASYGEGDPRAWSASGALGGSPGTYEVPLNSLYTNVVINEILAHTDPPQWDYIELYNKSAQAINLTGCMLSDEAKTNKFILPNGATIPARGFLIYYEGPDAVTNFSFSLLAAGEDVYFRSPNTTVVDCVRFAAQENGVGWGRYPDGGADFHELTNVTPCASNAPLRIRPVAINEIMYHPISEQDDDEYIELHNWSAQPVDISYWRFVEGITFTFPAGTVIPANGYLVVAKNAAHLMTNYPGLSTANTLGDYSGSLANSGERVVLAKPDDLDFPDRDFVVVDEVSYHDGGRWGTWADGGGSSLELIDPRSDHRRASNWADSDETAKSSWTLIQYTNTLDWGMTKDGAPINELHLLLLGEGECLVDNVRAYRNDVNYVPNDSFDSGLDGWTIQGNHVYSGLTNAAFSGSYSLCVRATGGGDTGANRIKTVLSGYFYSGDTGVLRTRARWLRGNPTLLLRLKGNYLEAEGHLPVPNNLGTPGAVNSRRVNNAGPAIWEVSHYPLVPATNQSVQVTARVHDPDGLNYVRLKYRLDPWRTTNWVSMMHAGGGVYCGTIPAQGAGQLVAFHIEARDNYASPVTNRFPADASARECLVRFGDADPYSALGTYRFWLTQTNIDIWSNRERHSDQYLDATFVCGNDRVIYNSGIRWRGSPFIRPYLSDPENYENRGAYRVELPKDEKFLGVDELNLDTLEAYKDPTLQRERASFRIAEQLGLSISYQRYVMVYLNGIQHPYAYADTHHVESDYLAEWFDGEDDGELYKLDDWFEFNSFAADDFASENADLGVYTTTGGQKKKARYRWNWDNKSKGSLANDYTHLFQLADAANSSDDVYTASLESQADMQQWMKLFAFRHVVADWDGYGYNRGKNMLMYRPLKQRWKMLLWDLDFALGADPEMTPTADLFQVAWYTPAVYRMMQHPPFRRYYWQTLKAAAEGPLRSSRVDPAIGEIYKVLLGQGVAVTDPSAVKSWISQRRTYILSQLQSVTNLSLSISSNGGANFSTNRNSVTLSGNAPIQIHSLLINGIVYPVEWSSVTSWNIRLALTSGVNRITVTGHDENGQVIPGLSDEIQISYTGADETPEGNLIIHEIMYHPLAPDAEYLELRNLSTNYSFNLAGYRLAGVDFTFGEGAVIGPGGYLLLVENLSGFALAYTNVSAVAGEFDGQLDNSGDRLRLLRTVNSNEVVVDEVIYDRLPPWPQAAAGGGPSLQLIDPLRDHNRVGNWAADTNVLYTPGAANSVSSALPEFPRVWLNEIQPNNVNGLRDRMNEPEPWIELFNAGAATGPWTNFYLTDSYTNLLRWAFPTNATLGSNQFKVIFADGETEESTTNEFHANFRLNLTNGSLALVHSNAGRQIIVDYMNYPRVAANRSYGSYPDGVWTNRGVFMNPTPGSTNNSVLAGVAVVINEWLADANKTLTNPMTGLTDSDWFELYNAGEDPFDLSGYVLTDNLSNTTNWHIPTGTVIAAQGYLLVWADDKNSPTNLHTNFKLSKSGEALGLFTPEGARVDSLTFGAQTTDVSQGRWPDAQSAPFYYMKMPTPGSVNLLSSNRFVLTIQTEHGIPNPGVGQFTNFHGALLNVAVSDAPASGGTQYMCRGWTLTGQEPRNGLSSGFTLAVTNHAMVTWLWLTNVWLETESSGSGSVHGVEGWYPLGTTVCVTAQAGLYYHFTNWSGDVPSGAACSNPVIVPMSRTRSLMALFEADMATNLTPVWWLASYGLTNHSWEVEALSDQDTDGLSSWQEWYAGTDPTSSSSVLEALNAAPSASGGLVVRWSSVAGRYYRIMQASNLMGTASSFQQVAGHIPATPDVNVYTTGVSAAENRFFRIEIDP
jgi:hypothetical protein